MAELVTAGRSAAESFRLQSRTGLIVTRTPLRVSFAGGGTDLADFYEREEGAVLSTAINKYVYVTLKPHAPLFGENYRLNYSETEHAQSLPEVRNEIARECFRLLGPEPPVYVSTVADLPASTGLGSSSSFAVGLLNAIHAYRGERVSAGQLAEEACRVEIEILKKPIGKQDQYAAAFGGLNCFSFRPDGAVSLEPLHLDPERIERLFRHTLMFYTGMTRDSSSVLREQKRNTDARMAQLRAIRGHVDVARSIVRDGCDPHELGVVLDETWQFKRQLAASITNPAIDAWYAQARRAGAWGGKLLGAGGGGFLLFLAPPERHAAVRAGLAELTEIPVRYESQGSRLLLPTME